MFFRLRDNQQEKYSIKNHEGEGNQPNGLGVVWKMGNTVGGLEAKKTGWEYQKDKIGRGYGNSRPPLIYNGTALIQKKNYAKMV